MNEANATKELDGAMLSVWIHGNWRHLTKDMTTSQKEAAAEAVQRGNSALGEEALDDRWLRWWQHGCYHEKPHEGAHIYTTEEFRSMCEAGAFTDYDGYGHPMRDGMLDEHVSISPENLEDIPPGATHVVWYNR